MCSRRLITGLRVRAAPCLLCGRHGREDRLNWAPVMPTVRSKYVHTCTRMHVYTARIDWHNGVVGG